MPANGSQAIASFTLTTQAQVDYVIRQDWGGSFAASQLRDRIARTGSAIGFSREIYCWKIVDIQENCPSVPKSKSQIHGFASHTSLA